MRKFKFQNQFDSVDCGPSCLKMVALHYGKDYSLEYLRNRCYINREGVSLLNINDVAQEIGFRTLMAHTSLEALINECPLPCILHWNQNHYVVLYEIKKRIFSTQEKFIIADPGHGIIKLSIEEFAKSWVSDNKTGTLILLEPTSNFYNRSEEKEKKVNIFTLLEYLAPFKKYLVRIVLGMLISSIIAFIFPFLNQVLVDEGIANRNEYLILIILISQLLLFVSNIINDMIRNWIILHLNAKISLSLISNFLSKLLRLPIKFFDSKAVGDISQRINDHHRIEGFLTGTLISFIFSILNIVVFGIILFLYNKIIFGVFLLFSSVGIFWISLFQHRRKVLDYVRFDRGRENQDKTYEMINGMQEIKLYGAEKNKREEWENIQIKFFKLNIKSLSLEQLQQSGFTFLNTLKNIIISFIAAKEVINGNISLGILLSISYIVGQMNAPIEQIVLFIKSAQDARLSMNRLQEVFNKKEEEKENVQIKPLEGDIMINNVSYQYEGPHSPFVLNNITFSIPKGKITAIVGMSGSGKTTLMKLLLGFYKPTIGNIKIGDIDLEDISSKEWRKKCGTVMQDGYIFYDTIARNISFDGEDLDMQRLEKAVTISNLKEFVESLSLGYSTKIGSSGIGISGGQKQRVLLARAVYKEPEFLFFDEATSNLDANNEKTIMNHLEAFFKGKTVVIIAHRLSTVKNADQIIVLENGKLIEMGSHSSLVKNKEKYFELVKNQLDLG